MLVAAKTKPCVTDAPGRRAVDSFANQMQRLYQAQVKLCRSKTFLNSPLKSVGCLRRYSPVLWAHSAAFDAIR